MVITTGLILGFVISLVISALVIFVATKLFGEREGFGTALLAAFVGALIFAIASYFVPLGWVAALIAGIAWLIALAGLYSMGLFKSFVVAVIIWALAAIVSYVLPTIAGPL